MEQTIEEKIQNIVLMKYKSVREFTQDINMPNSTFVSIMRRGIQNASVTNIIQICRALGIKVEPIAEGRIEYLDEILNEPQGERVVRLGIVFNTLSEEDKKKVEEYAQLLALANKR